MAERRPLVIIDGRKKQLPVVDRLPIAAVASGTPDGTKFVRDDGTLATPAGGGGGAVPDFLLHAQGII